jgi:hypothetical protein
MEFTLCCFLKELLFIEDEELEPEISSSAQRFADWLILTHQVK